MRRDPLQAASRPYDLIVVGGGVYGVAIALECVARGRRPLLVERSDFGERTTSNSLRIIHGGLRYLQSMDLRRFRRSVEQRRWWLRTFPELVKPLRCLMPLHGRGLQRPSILRVALQANDLLSPDRNRQVKDDRRIPAGRVLGPDPTLELFPGCRPEGLQGGALWCDAAMESPHRLIMEMLRWIVQAGGTALNYVTARQLWFERGRVAGMLAVDRLTGQDLKLAAPLVINAAGPWSAMLAARFDRQRAELFRPSLAFNVLLRRRLPARVAVAVSAPGLDAPIRFLQPLGDLTLAGTVHLPCAGDAEPDAMQAPTKQQVRELLEELNRAMSGFDVSTEDVVRLFWGWLPAAVEQTATLRRHPVVVDHGRDGGAPGLFSVSGVKFTTAPAVARRVLDRAWGRMPRPDWGVMADLRPDPREWPRAPAGEAGATDPAEILQQALPCLSEIVGEEAVVFAEDLVSRRLDWNLADLDLGEVNRAVTRLLPELPLRSREGLRD